MRVLIVDDEASAISPLRKALEKEGHVVDVASDGAHGLKLGIRNEYDVIVLDMVMPEMDGVAVCTGLRARDRWVPVLLVSGLRDTTDDRVAALDAGADDFIGKPYDLLEIMARLRALARRKVNERPTSLNVDDLCLDPATRIVERRGEPIDLSSREFALLEFLMRRANEALSRDVILSAVWGHDYLGISNVVDVYVRYLRGKIDAPFGTDSIEAIRGIGYRMKLEH